MKHKRIAVAILIITGALALVGCARGEDDVTHDWIGAPKPDPAICQLALTADYHAAASDGRGVIPAVLAVTNGETRPPAECAGLSASILTELSDRAASEAISLTTRDALDASEMEDTP